jgi:hypothetical protein
VRDPAFATCRAAADLHAIVDAPLKDLRFPVHGMRLTHDRPRRRPRTHYACSRGKARTLPAEQPGICADSDHGK